MDGVDARRVLRIKTAEFVTALFNIQAQCTWCVPTNRPCNMLLSFANETTARLTHNNQAQADSPARRQCQTSAAPGPRHSGHRCQIASARTAAGSGMQPVSRPLQQATTEHQHTCKTQM